MVDTSYFNVARLRQIIGNFLSFKEGTMLEAIAEQFIPADIDPGAREACVVNFIDTQLTKHYIRFQQRYHEGLASMEKTCGSIFNSDFESLPSEKQVAFLESMEKNDVPMEYWSNDEPSSFFNLMLSHCMQGFYGDPRHGGNCNHVSYQMVGLTVFPFYQPEASDNS